MAHRVGPCRVAPLSAEHELRHRLGVRWHLAHDVSDSVGAEVPAGVEPGAVASGMSGSDGRRDSAHSTHRSVGLWVAKTSFAHLGRPGPVWRWLPQPSSCLPEDIRRTRPSDVGCRNEARHSGERREHPDV